MMADEGSWKLVRAMTRRSFHDPLGGRAAPDTVGARYGPWALVVGASDGIGAAFARVLAARGLNVVLIGRREPLLAELARRLRTAHGVRTRVAALDAAAPDGAAAVLRAVAGLDCGLLVCNAALAPVGPFLELAPGQLDGVLDLNCRLAAHLSHALGGRMARRGRGGIILLSSMAGQQGVALVAHYAATKAYLRVLAEGLWAELGPSGVDVLACCPGLVRTPTLARSRPAPAGRLVPPPMDPERVVGETLAALGRRPVLIPGRRNRLAAFVTQRLLPRRVTVALASATTRAMYPRESRRPVPGAGPGA
jgi:short-subunit dehydrogenase